MTKENLVSLNGNSKNNIESDEDCCVEDVQKTIQKIVRVFQLFERDQIKALGFTTSQCYCLTTLLNSDGLPMNELSEKMNLDTSTMTRIVDKLVRDKYIQRERFKEDRRVVIVKLSEKGFSAATDLQSQLTAYYKKIIDNLPKGRVEEVLETTELLLNAFEKANPGCC